MSGKEFTQTGLVKLTDEELALLNEWIRRHSVATLDNVNAPQTVFQTNNGIIPLTTDDSRGLGYQGGGSRRDPEDRIINGTIFGTFDGRLSKGVEFRLTNGMVWEQTEKEDLSVNSVSNADVTITKSSMGNWHLSVVGQDWKVRVKRTR